MAHQALRALNDLKIVFIIILLMGASIAMWLSSGTVAFLMVQGMVLAKGDFFLPVIYLLSAICSLLIGTALGTFSTVGLAFLGMGRAMGVPDPLLIGTLISGVFLADRLAPMSGLVTLMLRQSGTSYRDFFKASWKRIAVVMVFNVVFYGIAGMLLGQHGSVPPIHSVPGFYSSVLLWLMPVLMIVLAARGVPTVWTLGGGVAAGFVLSILVQGDSFLVTMNFLLNGFSSPLSGLKGGGVLKMLEVICIVGMAIIYNQMLAETGMTQVLLERVTRRCSGTTSYMRRMAALSLMLTSLTCDQTVGILLPLDAIRKGSERMNIDKEVQASLVANTGVLVAPIEFWNVNALIISALTGVSALQYGPWCIFCWLLPLWAVIRPERAKVC